MTDREKAMKRVQMYCFACNEAVLFLDTHPNDKQALEYMKKMKAMLQKAKEDYTMQHGMLSVSDINDNADTWDWIKSPWPWMTESEGER